VLRCDLSRARTRGLTLLVGGLLTVFFLGLIGHSLVDQTMRGLYSSGRSASYRDAFDERIAIKNFLQERGLQAGEYVGLVGSPPVYWARMAGLKIVGEVESEDEYLKSSPKERAAADDALSGIGIKALVAKGEGFGALAAEGWGLVPGTGDYYAVFLTSRPPEISPERNTAQ